jgi:hypothetical protein
LISSQSTRSLAARWSTPIRISFLTQLHKPV